MLSTPEGRAWAVLITAFAVFCILVVTIPLAVRWHVINATVVRESILEKPIDGAVYVIKELGSTDFIRVTERDEHIPEGATIATDEHLRAFLRLFDGSTLTLYNNTQIVLDRVRSPRYAASPRDSQVQIRVERGRVAVGVASPLERGLHLLVQTPHSEIVLEEGGYSLLVDQTQTQLTIRPIRPGQATVTANGESLLLRRGRCRITEGASIEGPLPDEQDLVVNGSFSSPLDRGWEESPPQRQDKEDPYGEARIVLIDGKRVLSFVRRSALTHGENSVLQRIDKDVRGFLSLKLTLDVLVNRQSLPGGGYESTEFPVMIELRYKDLQGNTRSRYWGFYYLDPGQGPEWKTIVNGTKVIQGEWYLFETGNLVQSMGDTSPVYIESLRVYASGWNWDSDITNISLLVQE